MRFGRPRPSPLAPDPDLIRTLSRLLAENGLTEIEYAVGDRLIRVSRGITERVAASGLTLVSEQPLVSPTNRAAGAVADHPGAITAPMVGTVYLAPQPGQPAFVRIGETVTSGQPLLIIEAMKVMNEIRAPRPGRVVQILVEDSQPVEYGMPLMLIE
ncbi:MAG: acetyl-CoA carboxylase biotin carboxyl carrier protein subunit [Stellaceae bacterium]